MNILLAFAAAGATYITGLQTEISAAEAEQLNIAISVIDMEKEYLHPYPLYLFDVDLEDFDACVVQAVWIQFFNEDGQLAFASNIEGNDGRHSFQILAEYLDTAGLGITCDSGPDTMNPSYIVNLRQYGRAAQR